MQIRLIAKSLVRHKGLKMRSAPLKVQSSNSLLTLPATKGFIADCVAVFFFPVIQSTLPLPEKQHPLLWHL